MQLFVFLLATAFAAEVASSPLQFAKQVHFSVESYDLDGKNAVKIPCKAYSNLSGKPAESPKLRFRSKGGLEYGLVCKAQEIGDQFDLEVFSGPKRIASVPHAAAAGGDAGYNFRKDAWLVDLNRDGHLDLFLRLKSDNCEDCETAATEAERERRMEKKDEIDVFYWSEKESKFLPQSLGFKELKPYVKRFDFK